MAPDERKLMHQHQQHHLHLHQHHQQAASAATALESVDNIWFQSSDLTETNFCKQYVSLPLSFDLSGLCVKRILSSQKRSLEPNFHDLEYSVVLWLEQNVELLYIYVVYGVLCIGIVYMYCGQSRAWSLLRGQKTGAASSFFFFRQNFLPSPSHHWSDCRSEKNRLPWCHKMELPSYVIQTTESVLQIGGGDGFLLNSSPTIFYFSFSLWNLEPELFF